MRPVRRHRLPRADRMRFYMKRLLCLLLPLCLLMTGCNYDAGVDQFFRCNISTEPATLDPQLASDSDTQTVLLNCFEGLMRLDADGEPIAGVAERYEISADGLRYTFYLRRDAVWRVSKDETKPVTAHDFVFAFQRIYSAATASPATETFACIRNSAEVLSGALAPDSLGVEAKDDYTLILSLSYRNEDLLYLLTTTAAMPCNEAFFDSTGGKYGLESDSILCNGPFYLQSWTHNQTLILRCNLSYYDLENVLPSGIAFYIDDPSLFLDKFTQGNTDCVLCSGVDGDRLAERGYDTVVMENTTWLLALNIQNEVLGNESIRLALVHGMDLLAMEQALPSYLTRAYSIVPACVEIGGVPYRETAGDATLPYDPGAAREAFDVGMAQVAEQTEQRVTRFPTQSVLVPDTGSHSLLISLVQPVWQKDLLAFINIEKLSLDEIYSRMAAGDWAMAVVPVTSEYNDPASVLRRFTSGNVTNPVGYADPAFDELLHSAASVHVQDQAAALYAQAERRLLEAAVVVPLYDEATCCVLGKGVSGIEVSPFGGRLYFAHARRYD